MLLGPVSGFVLSITRHLTPPSRGSFGKRGATCTNHSGFWPGWGRFNTRAALTKTDRAKSVPRSPRAEDYLVAVLEVAARLAAGQLQRLSAAVRQLVQAGAIRVERPRRRAAAEQIARLQIAPVAHVVSQHLRERPVHVDEIGAGDVRGLHAFRAHAWRQEVRIKLDVEAARGLIRVRVQVGKRGRIALWSRKRRRPERRKRFGGHDPWRHRRRQALAEKWAKHALPTL